MFSKACEYGIRATLYIVQRSLNDKRSRIKDIARQIGAPEAFTAKVLQDLVRQGLLQSVTGPKGGFYLEKEKIKNIKLIDIVIAIDGNDIYDKCALGLRQCDPQHPCPVHHKFVKIKEELKEMLSGMNMEEMALRIEQQDVFLKY